MGKEIVNRIIAMIFIGMGLIGSLCAIFPLVGLQQAVERKEIWETLPGAAPMLMFLGVGYLLFFGYIAYLVEKMPFPKLMWGVTAIYNACFPALFLFSEQTEGTGDVIYLTTIIYGPLILLSCVALAFELRAERQEQQPV